MKCATVASGALVVASTIDRGLALSVRRGTAFIRGLFVVAAHRPRSKLKARVGTVDNSSPCLDSSSSPTPAARGNTTESAAAQSSDGTVTYFRVQGGTWPLESRTLVHIDASGNATFSNTSLNVSSGTPEHATYFLSRRPGANIVSFKVPNWFHDLVMESAVDQKHYLSNPLNQNGLAPKLVDKGTPGLSLELPPVWSKWLNENVIPGSGRIH